MRSNIFLGRIFGIRIGLHYSWFIIAFLIVLSLSAQFRIEEQGWSSGYIMALALVTAVLFFVSLLLHELSHSLVARSFGMPVREITLFALGGVSNIEKKPASAPKEFWMALAGPVASAALGGILKGLSFAAQPMSGLAVMLSWLGYINLALAVFNLIPGYPLDGGRILRALVWWKTGSADKATRIAARAGQVVGIVFIALGIFQFFAGSGFGGLWLAFIGWFLVQAAASSYLEVDLSHALEGVTVSDLMTGSCPAVDGNMDVRTFVEQYLLHGTTQCAVVTDNTGASGLVTANEIKEIERAKWPFTRLFDIMRPVDEVRTVTPETPLKTALEIMGRKDLNQLPVVVMGKIAGVLSRAQVLSYLQNRMQLQH